MKTFYAVRRSLCKKETSKTEKRPTSPLPSLPRMRSPIRLIKTWKIIVSKTVQSDSSMLKSTRKKMLWKKRGVLAIMTLTLRLRKRRQRNLSTETLSNGRWIVKMKRRGERLMRLSKQGRKTQERSMKISDERILSKNRRINSIRRKNMPRDRSVIAKISKIKKERVKKHELSGKKPAERSEKKNSVLKKRELRGTGGTSQVTQTTHSRELMTEISLLTHILTAGMAMIPRISTSMSFWAAIGPKKLTIRANTET